jgi:hypothetical protein
MSWDSGWLDALAERLLGPIDPDELGRLADDEPDVMRSDELDGRLALRAAQSRGHLQHLDRIGALRHCLELARFNGFSAAPRATSHWFQSLFEPGGAYTRPPPAPLEVGPADVPDELRLPADVVSALVLAASREERRRLLVAYSAHSEQIQGVLDAMTQSGEWSRVASVLIDLVRDGRKRGWAAACAAAPPLVTVEPVPSDVERALLTTDESVRVVWLAYLEAPAWHRRREILERDGEVLLDPATGNQIDGLWHQVEGSPLSVVAGPAREVLEHARRTSVQTAFAAELPPSEVMMNPALHVLQTATGTTRVAALRTLVHFFDPSLWPTMHARLSSLYADMLLGSEEGAPDSADVEQASEYAMQAAADVMAADMRSEKLARDVHLTLAIIQTRRARGPRDRHIETAIRILETLAEGSTADPAEAAQVHVHLAECFIKRLSGTEQLNAYAAREHAATALKIGDATGNHPLMVRGHTLLGAAINRILPRGEDVDRSLAIRHLQRALELTPEGSSASATAHIHLGGVQAVSGPAGHAAAMHHLQAALGYYTRERSPSRWAEIHEALGNALLRGRPDDPDAWTEARSHYLVALEEYGATPALQMRCRTSLATTFFRAHQWREALNQYLLVLDIAGGSAALESTEAGRLGLVADLRNVHERTAYCLAQLGDPWQALHTLELGRLTGLRRLYGGSQWAETAGRDLVALLRSRADAGVIAVPLITSAGSLCFLLTPTDEGPRLTLVPLPGLAERDLRLVLDGGPGRRGWLFAYAGLLHARESEDLDSADDDVRASALQAYDDAFDAWSAEIWRALDDLGRLLMEPLAVALRSAGVAALSTVRLVPSKWLSSLPLQAARGADGRPFADSFGLAILPALWLLGESSPRPSNREPAAVCLVAGDEELEAASAEARAVARSFGLSRLLPADWDGVSALVGLLDRATHLHITCHGEYDWERPNQSGLRLSDGGLLSAEAIARLPLGATELVTLSACESGLTDSDRAPSEYLGLPGSLLAAGARTIVSSLWVVDDDVTRHFMAAFYSGLREYGDPAPALHGAQTAIREAGFGDAFYWAAFTLIDVPGLNRI